MERERAALNAYIGRSIRAFRQAKGMTLSELSQLLCVSYQQVQKYGKGKNRLSVDRLYYIAKILRVDIRDFLPDGAFNDDARKAPKIIAGEAFCLIQDEEMRGIVMALMNRLTASAPSDSSLTANLATPAPAPGHGKA